jgi:uncharacterized Tic20 family protein
VSDQLPPPPGDQPPAYTPPPPPPGPGPAPGPGGAVPLSQSDERMWAMLAHIGGIIIGFLSGLLVMLIFGKRSAFTNDQAKEALNFQITLLIGYVISFILIFVIIGILLIFALSILNIVFCIIAGIAANKGETYRYPFAIRLVK